MQTSKKNPTKWEHLIAILQLPFIVLIVIPSLIYYFSKSESIIPMHELSRTTSLIFGTLFLLIGLILFILSIDLFVKIGRGTLAPWNPTKKLVVKSLYRYVRNPMIIGVNLILLGEGFLFQTGSIIVWGLIFILMNHLHFIFKEEPDLVKRFGEEYLEYKNEVPRWIPRLRPWRPELNSEN